ncbi:YhcH/YjgK/YiaL family protein [Paenibacillus cremeus]|uniref:YhcH/YjgK/YiaL family protein n=1 Tax=Paenibacillus cremeus TaxID=2163881 RepID=UPI00164891E3|nr:YhcH/YjgK/YiaL family protein [Paenibacillus cremeus]
MIFSDLKNWQREKQVYPKAVNRGLEYIQNTDFSTMKPGNYEIEGQLMFAMLQERITTASHTRQPESHLTYTDIQYLIEGEEIIRVAHLTGEELISEDTFEEKDLAFYSKVGPETSLLLQPGSFAVFYPGDVHLPVCSVTEDKPLRKVVIKIHKSLLFE